MTFKGMAFELATDKPAAAVSMAWPSRVPLGSPPGPQEQGPAQLYSILSVTL